MYVPSLPCSLRCAGEVASIHTADIALPHHLYVGLAVNGRVQPSLQSLQESSSVPPPRKEPAPPEQVLPFLPCSIRELELLQPLQRSTSFTPLWIRFKAKSCTHPGRGIGCIAAAGWGRIGLEDGQPSRTFLSTALPSPAFQDELLITGPGRGRQPCLDLADRQTDPFSHCRVAVGHIFGYHSAV